MTTSILTGKTTKVLIGYLEIDGILTTCGQFFVAIPQMVELNLVQQDRGTKRLEATLGITFPSATKIKTDLNSKAVNCVSISDFRRIVKASAKKGNESADLLLDILLDLSLEQLFSDAFGSDAPTPTAKRYGVGASRDFHPSNGVLWLDLATHQHLGWVRPKGCGADEVDESISD